MKVKVTQLCSTLYDPVDYSTGENNGVWVAIPFSRRSS